MVEAAVEEEEVENEEENLGAATDAAKGGGSLQRNVLGAHAKMNNPVSTKAETASVGASAVGVKKRKRPNPVPKHSVGRRHPKSAKGVALVWTAESRDALANSVIVWSAPKTEGGVHQRHTEAPLGAYKGSAAPQSGNFASVASHKRNCHRCHYAQKFYFVCPDEDGAKNR
jgi:hypothetical protein